MSKTLISIILITILTVFIFVVFNLYYNPKIDLPIPQKLTEEILLEKPNPRSNYEVREIKIGDKNYQIFVANTEQKKSLGLAAFESIENNEGMLFEFNQEGFHSFWMKNMKFDIDIIFLDKNKKIVEIFENVSKDTYKNDKTYQKYVPNLKSQYVIELRAGEAKLRGLKVGNIINF